MPEKWKQTPTERKLHARNLIRNDQSSTNLNVCEDMCDVHDEEYERARNTGECSEGCDRSQLVQTRSGAIVCRWTRKPCDKHQLVDIVKAFEGVNA